MNAKTEKYESYTDLFKKDPELANRLDKYNTEQEKLFYNTVMDFLNKYARHFKSMQTIKPHDTWHLFFHFNEEIIRNASFVSDERHTKDIVRSFLIKYNNHILGFHIVKHTNSVGFNIGLVYDGLSKDYDVSLLSS